MTTIHIRREAGWADFIRSYRVVLDGREVGRLKRGEGITLPTTAGTHTLQLEIDWCRSNAVSFSIEDGGSRTFECGNNPGPFLGLLYIVLWPSDYLWLRPVP
jgi:hypothetical protein